MPRSWCQTPSRSVLGWCISRPKMPGAGAILREPGLGLKFPGAGRDTLISPTLSFHQVFGGSSLKQAGGLKTDRACVRVDSDVLDHDMPWAAKLVVRNFRTAVGVKGPSLASF